MKSNAKTVTEYLQSLPADRRGAISAVRDVILDNLLGVSTNRAVGKDK